MGSLLLLLLLLLLLALLWGVEWAQGQWSAGGERAGIQGQGPRINIQAPDPVKVQEGLCVLVPCSFYYPWSSQNNYNILTYWFRGEGDHRTATLVATNYYYWNKVKPEIAGRFKLLSHSTNSCSLSITGARKEDQGAYFFRVERGNDKYNYKEKKLNLQVTAQPDIDFEKPLVSGQPARLTCIVWGSCDGKAPLFSWLGDALDSLRSKIKNSQVLSFTPRLQDHGSNLTCRVKVPQAQVSTERTIRLNVSYTPQNLTIHICRDNKDHSIKQCRGPGVMTNRRSRIRRRKRKRKNRGALKTVQNASSLSILEGQALRLLCEADSNPPARLSWFRRSLSENDTILSNSSTLELPSVRRMDEGEFTCLAENYLGSQLVFLSLSVNSTPHLQGPSCFWEDKVLHCSCFSQAWPVPSLSWWQEDQALRAINNETSMVTTKSEGPWANSSVSLRWGLGPGLRLICKAQNAHGERSSAVLLLTGEQEQGSWPLVLTLIRGGLMGAGFLLTYGLTWIYYTRCPGSSSRQN
ncbi:sialic acid-binding Ig-like lectin 5 isoform X2 [Erinaceus europaeus]|uniref:Sialic acid-binding Ig-like lectin 5 isoform X2 n=1 Tax=Erinaceus europaeus TaxID=9365 RepID=A0ABM3W4B2_ERIEU|nr:sialic acid-binding Ig-like lectin 5 isoform X2 [Erinaceus europaeus]